MPEEYRRDRRGDWPLAAALVATAIAGIVVSAGDGSAASQGATASPRQVASLTFDVRRARSAAATRLSIDWQNPADPAAKPHSVTGFAFTMHRGTRLNQAAVPTCAASDAELIARGVEACPAAARIGSGTLVTDNGSPAVFPRFVENALTSFNGDGELIVLAESATEPPVRVVGRPRVEGRTITSKAQTFPGTPPPDPYLAYKHLELAGDTIVGERGAYLRTPKCPRRGYWTNRLSFSYHDGVEQRIVSRSPCRPRRPRR